MNINRLKSLYEIPFTQLEKASGDWLIPSLARFTFAASLLVYFWNSAKTKLAGPFEPTLNAYAQIFPRQMEAVGYDASQLGAFHWVVVMAGSYAEFILPALLVLGFLTRLSALGMIGFVAVQTLTDLFGHGALAEPTTLGAWFDGMPASLIMDQRLFWIVILIIPLVRGAGPVSVDRLIGLR